ncbi:MAG: hypothetical protein ACKPJJ_23860 [Planctomycetaceae bacterium]
MVGRCRNFSGSATETSRVCVSMVLPAASVSVTCTCPDVVPSMRGVTCSVTGASSNADCETVQTPTAASGSPCPADGTTG